jgi:hypothetical protein
MVFFAAGDFRVLHGRSHGHRYLYAVSKRLSAGEERRAVKDVRRSAGIVSWLERQFGPYPFGRVGGVIAGIPLDYALETATRPVYDHTDAGRLTVTHELAHQWFGDAVTVARWRYVWLNEGFATYAEHLYEQAHGGPSVDHWLRTAYGKYPASSRFWDLDIDAPGPADMWDDQVYDRGAMTLAALRNRIGPGPFATLLRQWVVEHGGGAGVRTADFQALAEQVSGEDLDSFFDAWLSPGRPADTTANGLG